MNQPAMLPGLLDGGTVHWICPLRGCPNGVTVATRTPPRCPRHGAMIPDPECTT